MIRPSRSGAWIRAVEVAGALTLACLPGHVHGLALNLTLQSSYSFTNSKTVAGSVSSSSETQALTQSYRLFLSEALFSQLRLDVGGLLNWSKGWTETDGVWSKSDQKTWNVDSRLSFGGRPFAGQLFFVTQQNLSESTFQGTTSQAPTVTRENFGFNGTWNVEGLPLANLTVQRTRAFDAERVSFDSTTDDVYLSLQYGPVRQLDLRDSIRFESARNNLALVTQDLFSETAAVAYGDRFLAGRLTVAAGYTLGVNVTHVEAASPTALVPKQQFPAAGLSLVESLPATADRDKLVANPALIDGNVTANAGLDIGFAPSLAVDTNYRDVGASFSDPLTKVNQLYVYVDRRLPTNIATALQWVAYRSDDNDTWAPVPVNAIQFGAVDNRFEIRIQDAQARYFKVVTKPLAVGVTIDQGFAHIYVTEIQLFDVESPGSAPSTVTNLNGTGTASARLLLVPSLNLAYDLSAAFFHATSQQLSWSVLNALSAGGRLSRIFTLTTRLEDNVAKSQLASGTAAQSELRLTTALSAEFLPTLRSTVTYQGQLSFVGSTLSREFQSALFSAGADFYNGIYFSTQLGYTVGHQSNDQEFATTTASASLSIVPNPMVTLGGTLAYSESETRPPGQPSVSNRTGLLQASLAFTPFPSLSANGSIARYPWYTVPTTIASVAVQFSPFPGGRLILSFQYNQTLDTASNSHSVTWGPTARWSIGPAVYVNVYYTRQETSYTGYENDSNIVFVALNIRL